MLQFKRILPWLLVLSLVLAPWTILAQGAEIRKGSDSLQMNVLCFKLEDNDSVRVDVYSAMPYPALGFVKAGDTWTARYTQRIRIIPTVGSEQAERVSNIVVRERRADPAVNQAEKNDISQSVFRLLPGRYQVLLFCKDELSGRELQQQYVLEVPHFDRTRYAISDALLVTSVEHRGDRLRITPFIGDDISAIAENFFVFVECYTQTSELQDSVELCCEMYDGTERVFATVPKRIQMKDAAVQQYLRITLPTDLQNGRYLMKIFLNSLSTFETHLSTKVVAQVERSLRVFRALRGAATADIDKAIRQLRYVASQAEIDGIAAGTTVVERRRRFEEFWRQLDPSPSTQRNEAFDEYYARIDYANKNFQSYNEGWLCDMGMVYIILGAPESNRREMSNDGRSYVQWIYSVPPRQFIFIDYSSFGDYRLSTNTPFSSVEKYRYRH